MFKLTPREQKLVILLGCLLFLGIVLRFTLPEDNEAARVERETTGEASVEYSNEETEAENKQSIKDDTRIMVHVAGEVIHPGVYDLDEGSRVIDALEKAGGSLDNAALERVNLAQPLIDGQQVFIPAVSKEGENVQHAASSSEQASLQDARVNINMADQSKLETLPGIGSVKSQSIINYREEHGPFQKVEDLLQVNGIGEKTLENIREQVTIY